MLNLFKANLTLYAEFHLHDETATAAYAQCLKIWLSKMKASSQEMGYSTKQEYSIYIASLFTFFLGILGIHLQP